MQASISKYTSGIISIFAFGILLISFGSCSDEGIDSGDRQSRIISFNVSDRPFNTRSSENADNDMGTLSTLTLEGDGNRLYLIPEIQRGISLEGNDNATRAIEVTSGTIADFGVYAATESDASAFYMDNVKVTRQNSWTPDKEYLWPGSGSLHFNAYSPYIAPDETGSEGIVSTPSSLENTSLKYVVPKEVSEQTDLMWATPVDASSSPCALDFNHALAAVRFITGDEMVPCKVKSIAVSGINGEGTLDLETGSWSDLSGSESYNNNLGVELTAADGSGYVAARTEITGPDNIFFLLPQMLTEDSKITLTIEYNGSETVFNASLAGQSWEAGNTYTYLLSANPVTDRFILNVTSPLAFNYTGGTLPFTVTSKHETTQNGTLSTVEVPWKAEFIDDSGNVISTPSWITSMPTSGNGSGEFEAVTEMIAPTFVSMSDATRKLRSNSPLGSESNPYNLSNPTGASTVENTANTYIINAAGYYSLPLVYGNAIKNGADNTAAYAPTRSREPFVNHLGNRILHPYIYQNTGCEKPEDAVLVWEGRLNLVKNVHLSDDGKNIEFQIPAPFLRQGNAVVGVRDASGTIMWSWQLWITDYKPASELHSFSYNGKSFNIMTRNLGRIMGGDETFFPAGAVKVKFTQIPADGSEGETVVMDITQIEKHVVTPDCHSFYQWGRKDPMISGIKEWYNSDHTEITKITTNFASVSNSSLGVEFEAELIKNPQVFFTVSDSGNPSFAFSNQWNLGTNAKKVKTVYDPCPVGFIVPGSELMCFRDMADTNFSFSTNVDFSKIAGFNISGLDNGATLFVPALGYRSGKSGEETTSLTGSFTAEFWSSHANTTEAVAVVLSQSDPITHKMPDEARLEGFGIFPVSE